MDLPGKAPGARIRIDPADEGKVLSVERKTLSGNVAADTSIPRRREGRF
jgi:hypothetical protein